MTELVHVPLGGRVGCPDRHGDGVHLFGSVAPMGATGLGNLAGYVDFNLPREHQWNNMAKPSRQAEIARDRLWLISSWAREVQRYSEDPLDPLTVKQIRTLNEISGNYSYRDGTQIPLLVGTALGGPGGQPVPIDVGHSLEVYGEAVICQALQPSTLVAVPPGGGSVAAQSGIVIDVLLMAWAVPIEESIGHRMAPYTQTAYQGAGSQAVIRIPPSARTLQIVRSGLEPTAPGWQWHVGDPTVLTTSLQLGTIDFPTTNQSPVLEVPHRATHLVSTSVANAAFHTLIWGIAP